MVRIIPFEENHQTEINLLLTEIASEFNKPISSTNSTATIASFDQYWMALKDDKIIGTIAILKLKNKNAVLKKMFVQKNFRRTKNGISILLLQQLIDWCTKEKVTTIFLGTMTQFKAAHRFYTKNGFQKIDQSELPIDFVHNPIDDIFYKKILSIK